MSDYKINSAQAMTVLGVSLSSLRNLVTQGKLEVVHERGKTKPVPMYWMKQVNRLAEELKRPVAIQPSIEPPLPQETAIAMQPQRIVAKYEPERHALPIVPIWKKIFLTLDEAIAYSGISRQYLLKILKEDWGLGSLEYARGWRVNRQKLEEFLKEK